MFREEFGVPIMPKWGKNTRRPTKSHCGTIWVISRRAEERGIKRIDVR